MNEFWKNIVRYPRFFVSSLAGLIIVIISPIKNLFRIRKLRILLILLILSIFCGVYFILQKMSSF